MSWMSALKLIPWVDVIEATPALVKGARRLLKRSRDEAAEVGATSTQTPPQTLPEALARVQQLEAELAQLSQAQADSAALLESMAEQQARLVDAVRALRSRQRLLTLALLLALGMAGAALWLLPR
jgi:hypothetical protein